MKRPLVVLLALLFGMWFVSPAWADDEDQGQEHQPAAEHKADEHPGAGDEQHAPAEDHPAAEHPAEDHPAADPAAGEHHDQPADTADADHDGTPDSQEHGAEANHDNDDDEGEPPYNKFDDDGDGKSDPELEKEWAETTAGFSGKMDEGAIDAALDARPEDAELTPSISSEQFRKIVLLVKKVVLAKMEKKMAKSSAKKMAKFSLGIFVFSLFGLGLLAIPLVMRKKYPGKGKILFKYSALAAATFFVTVNLFGGVLFGMKTAQGALGSSTNPTLAIANATFDTLYDNADDYLVMGKELFVPTLMALEGNSEEQPAVLLIENGMKVVNDAKVFISVAKMFKKLNVVFSILPIILFFVTMILFGLAIRPTLTEIVKLPMRAAAGEHGVGKQTTRNALKRVWGELLATLCTLAVLTVLTFVSGFILGKIVQPALTALIDYFALAVNYLQFVEGASSGVVFLALFSVVLFLALNLATLILSMSFFLGKCQKIFQARFNDGTPIAKHTVFFKWGIPCVLFVQLFPLLFISIAGVAMDKINDSLMSGIKDADSVPWTKIMLAGPFFLVAAFMLLFWAARGLKAIGFLFAYKVKPNAARPAAPAHLAEPV